MSRTLEQEIKRYEQFANACKYHNLTESQEEFEQHVAWLRELQERRKAPEIIYCHECVNFQCNMRFDGYVPKGADAYECRRGCGGCDPMDYCSYGERAERRTDAND